MPVDSRHTRRQFACCYDFILTRDEFVFHGPIGRDVPPLVCRKVRSTSRSEKFTPRGRTDQSTVLQGDKNSETPLALVWDQFAENMDGKRTLNPIIGMVPVLLLLLLLLGWTIVLVPGNN
jgi:hypothetical protein